MKKILLILAAVLAPAWAHAQYVSVMADETNGAVVPPAVEARFLSAESTAASLSASLTNINATATNAYNTATQALALASAAASGTDSNAWHHGDSVTNAVDAPARAAAASNADSIVAVGAVASNAIAKGTNGEVYLSTPSFWIYEGGVFRVMNGGNAEFGTKVTNEFRPYFYLQSFNGWTYFSHRDDETDGDLWITTENPGSSNFSNSLTTIRANLSAKSLTIGETEWTNLPVAYGSTHATLTLGSDDPAATNAMRGKIRWGWIENAEYADMDFNDGDMAFHGHPLFSVGGGTNIWQGRVNDTEAARIASLAEVSGIDASTATNIAQTVSASANKPAAVATVADGTVTLAATGTAWSVVAGASDVATNWIFTGASTSALAVFAIDLQLSSNVFSWPSPITNSTTTTTNTFFLYRWPGGAWQLN